MRILCPITNSPYQLRMSFCAQTMLWRGTVGVESLKFKQAPAHAHTQSAWFSFIQCASKTHCLREKILAKQNFGDI